MKIVRSFLAFLLLAVGLGALASPAVAYPAGQIATAQINSTVFTPGATVTVTVQHTTPGPLTMQIFSAPVTIGTGTVGPDFQGTVSGAVPVGYSGQHTIQVTGAGGEIFTFPIQVVGNNPGGGCNPVIDPPEGRALDAHTVQFSIARCIGRNQVATATLTDGAWTASASVSTDQDGYAVFRDVVVADPAHTLPTGTSQVFVSVTSPSGAGGGGSFEITVGTATPVPPTTTTPTVPPSGSSAPTTAPGTGGTGGAGSGSGTGGTLASTGVQVGLGAGLGLAALVGGGVLLVASRRRSAPRHGA